MAMNKLWRWGVLTAMAGLGAAALVVRRRRVPRVEEAPYERERTVAGVEIRRYPAAIVAETEVEGGYRESLYAGFRRLAGYLFGRNARAQTLALTAPVAATAEAPRRYTVRLVLPPAPAEALPRPLDERVRLRPVPARRAAALRFGGRATEEALRARQAELASRLALAGLAAAGAPELAQYDPPWTPGPLRRNEVIVTLAADGA